MGEGCCGRCGATDMFLLPSGQGWRRVRCQRQAPRLALTPMLALAAPYGLQNGLPTYLHVMVCPCRPDDATLAVLRAALAAAGEVSDGDWPQIREKVNRSLISKLLALDPHVRLSGEGGAGQGFCLCAAKTQRIDG